VAIVNRCICRVAGRVWVVFVLRRSWHVLSARPPRTHDELHVCMCIVLRGSWHVSTHQLASQGEPRNETRHGGRAVVSVHQHVIMLWSEVMTALGSLCVSSHLARLVCSTGLSPQHASSLSGST